MKDIIIIGAGGFGREIKCLLDDINDFAEDNVYNIVGFVDDGIAKNTDIQNLKVLGSLDYLKKLDKNVYVCLGVGNPKVKQLITSKLSGFNFPTLIHPTVSLSGYNITIGEGSIICKGVLLTCDIEIEKYVTVNLQCTIGHDVLINNFSSIMPSVNISGEVTLKENVYIGSGAILINQKTIGKNAIIGAGAVVTKDIPDNCTAVGAPAKPIKFHQKND